jgi:hypothetical protein
MSELSKLRDLAQENEETVLSYRVLQSYVRDKFFVSTCYRLSSAMYGGWYYETFAWKWDKDTRKTGEFVYQDEGLKSHQKLVDWLLENDSIEGLDKDDD